MKKKVLALVLSFAMAVTMLPAAPVNAGGGEPVVLADEAQDLALSASSVKSDYTAGWEKLEGINTEWEPTKSDDGTGKGWGNWIANQTETHCVQYNWSKPITTDWMQIYWYDDGAGTRIPATMKIQYRNDKIVSPDDPTVPNPSDDEGWTDVTMKNDYADVQEIDQYNAIGFEEITATSIRLVMTIRPGSAAMGIYRWKVMTPLSDKAAQQRDKDALTLPEWADEDFHLPVKTVSGETLTWESADTSVIKVEGNTAKVSKGSKEKTVKLTAKLNGKLFKEFSVIVAKRALLQDATVSLPVPGAHWWNLDWLINGKLDQANGNKAVEGGNVVQLNFARKLSLTGTKVYWRALDEYAPLPTGVKFQYLKNEVSPDDAESWENIELETEPTFTAETGDTYNFKNPVDTTKLRLTADLADLSDGSKGAICILEWEVSGEEYVDETDITKANAVKAKIEALGEPEYTAAFKAKIDEARSMYDDLTPTQQGLLEDIYKTLTDAEEAYGNLEAADAVIKAIDAILTGNVTEDGKLDVTESNKEQIQAKVDAARTAYGKLNEAQQDLVTNYNVLRDAEAVLKDFGRSDAEILADLVEEINAIGNADDMTPANMEEYKTQIEAAESRRDNLKDQSLVTDATGDTKVALDKLTALRTKYNKLKTDMQAAKPVIDAISVIGNLLDTEECYGRFQNAKTQFAALTPDQKALVSNKETLDAAETYFTGKTIVTALTITEPESKTLKVGDKFKLTAETTPAGATVTWTSSKPETVKVSETTGDIEAVAGGTATITATAGNNKKTATITFTVEAPTVEVTELTVTPTSKTMTVGDKFTLTAKTTPANQKVAFKLSSGDAVKVSETTGEVEALKAGKATITATAGTKTATCEITVTEKGVEITNLTLSDESKELKVDEEFDLTATTTPADQKVTWESSDNTVISMTETENGKIKVKALKEGKATITATAGTKTATCEITVTEKDVEITNLTLSDESKELKVDEEFDLTATTTPAGQKVTWGSSDNTVISITETENGKVKVKALKEGTATITATAGKLTKSVNVKVTKKEVEIKKITLPMKKLTMGNGDKITLKPTITPANTTNMGVTWSVDKKGKSIVTVKNGKITANKKKTGTAKVTVTSKSNAKIKATITITVKKQPKSIKLGKIKGMKKNTVTLKVKKTCKIKVTMAPKSAGSLLTFKTNNKKVATVDANGKVTAKKKGTAKITVTTGNKKKAILTVKVK